MAKPKLYLENSFIGYLTAELRRDIVTVARQLELLNGIPEIEVAETDADFAEALVRGGPPPEKAALDALHIAAAVSGGMDYLLTWNFKHLANATMRNQIERICRSRGYEPPIMCTPEELITVDRFVYTFCGFEQLL